MVSMQMREQHAVDRSDHVRIGDDPHERTDPVAQHGIGDHAHAVDLDQHRGVAEPGDRELAGGAAASGLREAGRLIAGESHRTRVRSSSSDQGDDRSVIQGLPARAAVSTAQLWCMPAVP